MFGIKSGREIVKGISGSHINSSQREDKTNIIEGLVFGKFSSDGNLYLIKISLIKTAYIIIEFVLIFFQIHLIKIFYKKNKNENDIMQWTI